MGYSVGDSVLFRAGDRKFIGVVKTVDPRGYTVTVANLGDMPIRPECILSKVSVFVSLV